MYNYIPYDIINKSWLYRIYYLKVYYYFLVKMPYEAYLQPFLKPHNPALLTVSAVWLFCISDV